MHTHLEQLHQQLYEDAKREALSLATLAHPSVVEWQKQLDELAKANVKLVEVQHLADAIVSSSMTLYGDFHTLRQSQRGLLRLLRHLSIHHPEFKIVVGLECIPSKFQQQLDMYSAGELDEWHLKEACNFEKNWGFSWPNYYMVMEFCRDNNIPMLGLNSKKRGQSMAKRDEHAAAQIANYVAKHPERRPIIQIGEFHLLEENLPKFLGQSNPSWQEPIRIFNNLDALFFRHYEHAIGTSSLYFEIDPRCFSIQNTSPWFKWQSVIQHEEHLESEVEVSRNSFTEIQPDYDHVFIDILKKLCQFLDFSFDEQLLDFISIAPLMDRNGRELDDLKAFEKPASAEALRLAESCGAYMLASQRTIILRQATLNHFSNAAGQFLFSRRFHQGEQAADGWYVFCQLLAGNIASRIMNPRRKFDRLVSIDPQIPGDDRSSLTSMLQTSSPDALITLVNTWYPSHIGRIAKCSQSFASELYWQTLHNRLPIDQLCSLLGTDSESPSSIRLATIVSNAIKQNISAA